MFHLLHKISSYALITTLFLGMWVLPTTHKADAQTCDPNETPGNLLGFALTDNLDRIYMSTESWNLANPSDVTTVDFYVDYDRQTGLWSGRGWNEIVGWVDFGYDIIEKEARFEAPGDAYDSGSDEWGNWSGVIALDENMEINGTSIRPVRYSAQTGSFNGLGIDAQLTGGENDPDEDDYVGAGIVDFSNVSFVESDCDEYVDMFLNDVPVLHSSTCPLAAPTIKWTSQNVANCTTAEGLWASSGSKVSQYTSSNEKASGPITDVNSPVIFRLRCIGQQSGAEVYGVAVASCGDVSVEELNNILITYQEN